jgi:GNAT superfamily N-acetyltransferase
MSAEADLARELEAVAARAWPALEEQRLGGWRLRASGGVTHRGNSVWPNSDDGTLKLDDKLSAVEAFYAARGLPASYQMTLAAQPAGLDAALEARGYRLETPCLVMVADAAAVLARAGGGAGVSVAEEPGADWLGAWVGLDGAKPGEAEARTAFLGRTGLPLAFASASIDSKVAAVGAAALDSGWLGVFGMATQPAFRRRGLARAVLGALAAWGAARGAGRLYLQVIEANAPARALYDEAGFVRGYAYHYRERAV